MLSTFARFSILLILIGNYLWSEHLDEQDIAANAPTHILEQIALHHR